MPAFGVHPSVTTMQKGEVTHGFSLFLCGQTRSTILFNYSPKYGKRSTENSMLLLLHIMI